MSNIDLYNTKPNTTEKQKGHTTYQQRLENPPDISSNKELLIGLFISTSLDIVEFTTADNCIKDEYLLYTSEDKEEIDLTLDNIKYRKITIKYYNWLKSKAIIAKKAYKSGKLNSSSFNQIVNKFKRLNKLASKYINIKQVIDVEVDYKLPIVIPTEVKYNSNRWLIPTIGELTLFEQISVETINLIEDINNNDNARDKTTIIYYSEMFWYLYRLRRQFKIVELNRVESNCMYFNCNSNVIKYELL